MLSLGSIPGTRVRTRTALIRLNLNFIKLLYILLPVHPVRVFYYFTVPRNL